MSEPIETAYVHIPFCKSKCFYCDFNSYAGKESRIGDYFEALIREIRLTGEFYQRNGSTAGPLKSIFFGGGTPSHVPSEYIAVVMEELQADFGIDSGAEITIECNPGTIDLPKFRNYRHAGINRLSIGLQSTSDTLLRGIGRIHTFKQFSQCMDFADRTGLTNRNVDLMFGLPSQTPEDVDSSIRKVLEREVTHLSFYSLILESGTPFFDRYHDCPEQLPTEDSERRMYWFGVETLLHHGFMHYEISNLAKKGFSCKQNLAYWNAKEYLGFGAGAHSYQQNTRIENETEIDSYITIINRFHECSNAPAAVDRISLSEEEMEQEYFMLGFRLLEGVRITEFEKIFPSGWKRHLPRIESLIRQGYLAHSDGAIRLTRKGIDFANRVFMEFV